MSREENAVNIEERLSLDEEANLRHLERENAKLRSMVEDLYEIILRQGMVKNKLSGFNYNA